MNEIYLKGRKIEKSDIKKVYLEVGKSLQVGNATVKRKSRDTYTLSSGGRVRFGTRDQINEDLKFLREWGTLPPSRAHEWA